MLNKIISLILTITLVIYLNIEQIKSNKIHNSRSKRAITKTQCNYGSLPLYQYSDVSTCDECGKTTYTQNARIVGGISAVPYSWPAHVFIVQTIKGVFSVSGTLVSNQTILRRCGGTLIHRYAVLTAAHCITNVNDNLNSTTTYASSYFSSLEESFTVYAGLFNISFLTTNGNLPSDAVKLSVYKVIKHSGYSGTSSTKENDFALLILSTPVTLGSNIQIACLPDSSYLNYPVDNTDVIAVGWGLLSETGTALPYDLHNVRLQTYSNSYCTSLSFLSGTGGNVNPNNQLCAGKVNAGKDTCSGDSGGGLYVFDAAINKYVLAGVTSWGVGCARNDTLGIYGRVNYFNNRYNTWIMENIFSISFINGSITTSANTTTTTTTQSSTTTQTDVIVGAVVGSILGTVLVITVVVIIVKREEIKNYINKKKGMNDSKHRKTIYLTSIKSGTTPMEIVNYLDELKLSYSEFTRVKSDENLQIYSFKIPEDEETVVVNMSHWPEGITIASNKNGLYNKY